MKTKTKTKRVQMNVRMTAEERQQIRRMALHCSYDSEQAFLRALARVEWMRLTGQPTLRDKDGKPLL